MFTPDDIRAKLSSRYAESSIKMVDYGIRKICTKYMGIAVYDWDRIVGDLDGVIGKIEMESESSIRKILINALLQVAICNGCDSVKKLQAAFNKISEDRARLYKYREMDMSRFVSLEQINGFVVRCKDETYRFLLWFYSMFPALRGQDFFDTVVERCDNCVDYVECYRNVGYNYLDINNFHLVIGDHKTARSYGIKVIKLPESSWGYVNELVRNAKSKYLIHDEKHKRFNSSKFSYLLQSIFKRLCGKGLSVDDLRKIYISEITYYLQHCGRYSLSQQKSYREKVSSIMGHSLETQEFIYSGYRFEQVKRSSDEYMVKVLKILDDTEVTYVKSEVLSEN